MKGITSGSVLLLLAVLPLLMSPFHRYLLAEIFAWALFALAFDLLYGFVGMLSLGQSIFFGVGAYGAALTMLRLGTGLGPALLCAIGAATLLAALLAPLLTRVGRPGFIILTFILTLIFHLIALNLRWFTGGDDGLTILAPHIAGGYFLANTTVNYYFCLSFLTCAFLVAWWLVHTPLGKGFILVRENEQRAAALGYNVKLIKLIVIITSASLSGIAGAIYLLTVRFVSADLFHWTVAANPLVWTLLGGAGTLVGPLLGTIALLLIREGLSSWCSYGYPILIGLLIIIVVRFAPQGLWGTIARWGRWSFSR